MSDCYCVGIHFLDALGIVGYQYALKFRVYFLSVAGVLVEENRNSKYCQGCQAVLPIDTRECPYCHCHQLTRGEVMIDRLIHAVLPRRSPTTTCLLFGIVVYFIIISIDILTHPSYGLREVLLSPPGELIYRWGAHMRGEIVWWRLITANFVHFGILHILFNGYALRYVGPYVERSFGSALTFAAFMFLGTGSMLSNIWGGVGLVAGASGGLMALIGMAAVAAHREKTQLSLQVRDSMLKWAGFTIVFGLIVSFSGTMGIDNIAHVSGFILGGIAGFLLPSQSTTGHTKCWVIRVARSSALVSFICGIVAFCYMGSASASAKYQTECIANIKLKAFQKARNYCELAYKNDKSQTISYHNFIFISLINNDIPKASALCEEGRDRFSGQSPLSFDEMCRSIGK